MKDSMHNIIENAWRYIIFFSLLPGYSLAQQVFFDDTKSYFPNGGARSTLTMGFTDINGDLHDDLVTLDEGIKIWLGLNQGLENPLKIINSSNDLSSNPEWSFSVGDLNNDGISEILSTGVQNNIKVYAYDPLENVITLNQSFRSGVYGQGCNVVDINNDGWNDFFLSNDEGKSKTFINDGEGNLNNVEELVDFTTFPASDFSGNYGSEWIDLDNDGIQELYLAKCRSFATEASDPRRINQLFKKDSLGVYKDIAKISGTDDGSQSWSSTFADLDNDGDLDLIIANHFAPHLILENVDGVFIKKEVPFPPQIFSFQVKVGDFDNDGWIDILFAGDKDMILWNKKDFDFQFEHKPFNDFNIHSAALGDLNYDGFIDAYVSYGIPINMPGNRNDKIWINNGNDNHHLTISLRGQESNLLGLGAKALIYGPWGIQQRNVQGGQGYSTINSFNLYFGLGESPIVDSLMIIWPGGKKEKYYDIPGNNHYVIQENNCITKLFEINSPIDRVCLGDSMKLTLPQDFSNIQWNSGMTDSIIYVYETSTFSATAKDDKGCLAYSTLEPILFSDTFFTKKVFAKDTVNLCLGNNFSIPDEYESYKWSTEEGSTIVYPAENGLYTLEVTNACNRTLLDSVYINLIDPNTALAIDTFKVGQDAEISIEGKEIKWYISDEVQPFFIGNKLLLPKIEKDTMFYIERTLILPTDSFFLTADLPSADNKYTANFISRDMLFDVHRTLYLKSITVFTDIPGKRRIQIFDSVEDLVFERDFMLQVGENLCSFDLILAPGANYKIKTDESINNSSLGFNSPRLERTGSGIIFPIQENYWLSILGSAQDIAYYYFYNWKWESLEVSCESERLKKEIKVRLLDGNKQLNDLKFSISPNPASNSLYIDSPGLSRKKISIISMQGQIVIEKWMNSRGEIDVSNLINGMYLINVVGDKRSGTTIFIKTN